MRERKKTGLMLLRAEENNYYEDGIYKESKMF